MDSEQVGQAIRKALESKSLSQSELSRRTGINRQLIYKYLQGEVNMSILMLVKIAAALEMSLDDLVGYSPDKVELKPPKDDNVYDISEPAMEYVSMVEIRLSRLEEDVKALDAQIKTMKKDHARKEVVKV